LGIGSDDMAAARSGPAHVQEGGRFLEAIRLVKNLICQARTEHRNHRKKQQKYKTCRIQ
jgi:hypothetical protein